MTRPAPPAPIAWRDRLTVRLASVVLLTVVGAVGVTVSTLLWHAERDSLAQQEQVQRVEVQRTAQLLAQRVRTTLQMLDMASRHTTADAMDSAHTAAQMLQRMPWLLEQMDSVTLARPDGQVLLTQDSRGHRAVHGVNVGDRGYFQKALRTGQPAVSEPVASRLTGEPVVIVGVPMRHGEETIGVMAGALRLRSKPLLAGMGLRDDSLVAVTDFKGTLIAHPDPDLIGHPLGADPRLAWPLTRWVAAGRPVTGQALAVSTDEALAAVSAIPEAGWLVWRMKPRATVLAPLQTAQQRALATGAAVVLATMLPLLGLMWWMVRPLDRLRARSADLFNSAVPASGGWPRAVGEVGQLSTLLRQACIDREASEGERARLLLQLQSVLAAAPLGIMLTRDRHFELVSPETCRLLGRSEHQMLGQPAQGIFAQPGDYQGMGLQVGAAFAQRKTYEGEHRFNRSDGAHFWGRLSGRPVQWDDASAGTIWTLTNIDQEVAARHRLEWAASHDTLTGLCNRKALLQHLEAQAGAADLRHQALLFMDLDHFKPVNDQHGHAAGDAVLRAVGQTISALLGQDDLAVRLGGDEFAVVLAAPSALNAAAVAERLRRAISALQVDWHGHGLQVGVSVGVAPWHAQLAGPAAWLEEADAACYRAKAHGRDTVCQARPHADTEATAGHPAAAPGQTPETDLHLAEHI